MVGGGGGGGAGGDDRSAVVHHVRLMPDLYNEALSYHIPSN